MALSNRTLFLPLAATMAAVLACSGDAAPTMKPDPAAVGPKIEFSASEPIVPRGGKVTLSWKVTDADTISIVQAGGRTIAEGAMLEGSVQSPALDQDTSF